MNTNRIEEAQRDMLKAMFDRMTDDPLPPDFLPEMMQRIRTEAVRARKREAWRRTAALLAATLAIAGLAVAAFIYLDIPRFQADFPQIFIPPFYIYIGFLTLILLFADGWFRQKYFKKHASR
jgi:FtsH-binding integral membrane protein